MLIRESTIKGALLVLYNKPGEIISNDVLSPHLAIDLYIKLLKKQYPPDEARLRTLLLKEVLES